jgi:hypothetical protein
MPTITPTLTVIRAARGAYRYFHFVAVNHEHPGDPGARLHAFVDCWEITGNGCDAVEWTLEQLNTLSYGKELCWSCVTRLGRLAEAAES